MRRSANKKVSATGVLSARTVMRELAEFNRWRRGQGKYAWNEDPSKNAELPFTAEHLGKVIDRAVELLKTIYG